MNKALVFGVTGQLGASVAERLLGAKWQVWGATRGNRIPPAHLLQRGLHVMKGTNDSFAGIIRSLRFPVDTAFVPTAYDELDARDLLSARERVGSLVVVSSSSVYADSEGRSLDEAGDTGFPVFDGPISEETRTVEPGQQTYSTRKVAMEHSLLASGFPITILRPCAIYGRLARHPREWWFVKRTLDGRHRIPVSFGAKSVFHTSSARGIAELAEICMSSPAQRILNVADATPLTVSEIASAIERAINLPINLIPFEGRPSGPSFVGSTPWSVERPYVLDTSRATDLGWYGGEYANHVLDVCRWLVDTARKGDWRHHFSAFTQYGYDSFDYKAEDAWLAGR
ncbi:NAD-dependent epimerase/dehydratase family protein [Mesorhizobium sp. ES1-4]|uniref:NAD-dependent epimerase/dehydratase family protein n=1 Tax=Mesorhizobium sp. ES1-4 TaxID=2876627 RepID=UPI001CC9B48F|nr:NAD(P)-dependent oxidoreductase [Mesorhizobium sp. ES1-4]MBZ9795575.1 NAD(P)-dependent oxidoreductase [Mesorhizobium sp. ES1-4]